MLLATLLIPILAAADWPQFRGPGGLGVSESAKLPTSFGPSRNVVWKTAIPPGHSSPVIFGDRIFMTGAEGGAKADAGRDKIVDEGGKLYTICVDRKTGKILWKQQAPRPRLERFQPTNSSASGSPVTDGRNVYVFFGDFGLLAYTINGKELWRRPLGPFNNVNGHGSSPILFGNLLIIVCDQDTDSYLLAVDKDTGRVAYKVERSETTRSYVTPAIFRPAGGPPELIVPGAYQLTSYEANTGRKLWWIDGLSWQPKSMPVIDGGMIFAHWWENGGEAESATQTATFAEALAKYDANKDGRITKQEYSSDAKVQRGFENMDLNMDGYADERDWNNNAARRAARNALIAVRPGGKGNITNSHVAWRMQKFLPNCPTPLVYGGVLYLVKDGGIVTSLDPKSGEILKQGRLPGALDTYYASPVGGAGHVYMSSQQGKVTVLKAGAQWEIAASNDLEDEIYSTPALVDGKIYLRTRNTLYCFGE